MKSVYLFLAFIGFIAPNIFVAKETIETGNVLLWLDPTTTIKGMFGNSISTTFVIDLAAVALVFLVWSWFEARKLGIKNVWIFYLLILLFGLGGPFALFLYQREKKIAEKHPKAGA